MEVPRAEFFGDDLDLWVLEQYWITLIASTCCKSFHQHLHWSMNKRECILPGAAAGEAVTRPAVNVMTDSHPASEAGGAMSLPQTVFVQRDMWDEILSNAQGNAGTTPNTYASGCVTPSYMTCCRGKLELIAPANVFSLQILVIGPGLPSHSRDLWFRGSISDLHLIRLVFMGKTNKYQLV